MKRFLGSFWRVLSRTAFLAVAMLLALVLLYLPELLNLDQYRPELTDILESTFQCKVILGDVRGNLVPVPSLSVGRVVLLERSKHPRVLASVGRVQLQLAVPALWHGRFEFTSIRFIRPRFILHRDRNPAGLARWTVLRLPSKATAQTARPIAEWLIRDGVSEIWDHTKTPTARWVFNQFTGSFVVDRQTGALSAQAPRFGPAARLTLHYDGSAYYPVTARITDARLAAFQILVSTRVATLAGNADIDLKARFTPTVSLRANLVPTRGPGKATLSLDIDRQGKWWWSSSGRDMNVTGNTFRLSDWSAKSDPQGDAVYARGVTPQGGVAEVTWTRAPKDTGSQFDVDVSCVTIRQILEIFHLESKTPLASGFNPYGYEPWVIRHGAMKAVVHPGNALDVLESDVDTTGAGEEGMHLDLSGTFAAKQTHIQGSLEKIPVEAVVNSFFKPPAPITGTGRADFALDFPLSAQWFAQLNGPVTPQVDAGILRSMAAIYRVVSVLNLGNYLRLRFPDLTATGINFQQITGHLVFQNGVLSTEDLFLKSPNMNVGAKGTVNIPAKQLDIRLRLELFRFLEQILKEVPITHWIFKKPNKIFLPLVVDVKGPWENPDIQ